MRAIRDPRPERLRRQYREAYERFLCPVCEYPVRRGPMRFLYWDRRSIRKAGRVVPGVPEAGGGDEAYSCPSCGTSLFGACAACGRTRSTLLPHCEHCGAETAGD